MATAATMSSALQPLDRSLIGFRKALAERPYRHEPAEALGELIADVALRRDRGR